MKSNGLRTKAFKSTVFNTGKSNKRKKYYRIQIKRLVGNWWRYIYKVHSFTRPTTYINQTFTEYLRCAKHYIIHVLWKQSWIRNKKLLSVEGGHRQCSLQCNVLDVKMRIPIYCMLDTRPHISNSQNTLKQEELQTYWGSK